LYCKANAAAEAPEESGKEVSTYSRNQNMKKKCNVPFFKVAYPSFLTSLADPSLRSLVNFFSGRFSESSTDERDHQHVREYFSIQEAQKLHLHNVPILLSSISA
jgi:hypothetical protein